MLQPPMVEMNVAQFGFHIVPPLTQHHFRDADPVRVRIQAMQRQIITPVTAGHYFQTAHLFVCIGQR